jgi:alkylated DNA repair dioxygenase AlkB
MNDRMTDQASLFQGERSIAAIRPELPDADVYFLPGFFGSADSDRLLEDIDETTVWSQESFRMYGKRMPLPRLTAWYGESGKTYTYSKIEMTPQPWTPPLAEIRDAVQREAGASFNSVLLNLYRDGKDSVAWHSDDEPELEPVIASVSLGGTRRFQFRHKLRTDLKYELELTHGSLLLMRGPTQQNWQHQIPKTSRRVDPRINLTFRYIR